MSWLESNFMLRFTDRCALASGRITRREWQRIGSLADLSLTAKASELATKSPSFGRAKSVIVVFASGGQSQIDMWDPKPNAPLDVRGAFQPIATALPSVQFCEHMPQI